MLPFALMPDLKSKYAPQEKKKIKNKNLESYRLKKETEFSILWIQMPNTVKI